MCVLVVGALAVKVCSIGLTACVFTYLLFLAHTENMKMTLQNGESRLESALALSRVPK